MKCLAYYDKNSRALLSLVDTWKMEHGREQVLGPLFQMTKCRLFRGKPESNMSRMQLAHNATEGSKQKLNECLSKKKKKNLNEWKKR